MRLDTEFCKLPLRFDAERLMTEIAAFSEKEWRPHPQGYPGNSALPLIAVDGDPADDGVAGPMRPTPHLQRCPYLRQVLASLGAVLGRTRLMRLDGQAEVTPHSDTNYYWQQRVRVHVPVITFPEVTFHCGSRSIHMAAGECWIFDTWRAHNVLNPDSRRRIHLVADTVGSPAFWDLVDQAERPFAADPQKPGPVRVVPYRPGEEVELSLEEVNLPVVMPPWEQTSLLDLIKDELEQSGTNADSAELLARVQQFQRHWRTLWAERGAAESGWPEYKRARDELDRDLVGFEKHLTLRNGTDAAEVMRQWLVRPALQFELSRPRLRRPVFIVSTPRSGSTLLFETLARSPDFWTIGGEGHALFEGIESLQPERRGFDSNRLTEEDATAETADRLRRELLAGLRDRDGRLPPSGSPRLRVLEKTPKNALRIPFLNALFPDALFIYLWREPEESVSSILEAWRSGGFVTYPQLPGWEGPWSMLLVPGWRELRGLSPQEVAAEQWARTTRTLLEDLGRLPRERWTAVTYAQLIASPQQQVERLCAFAGVRWDQALQSPLPNARHTLTPPAPDKWKKNATLLEPLLPKLTPVKDQVRHFLQGAPADLTRASARGQTVPNQRTQDAAQAKDDAAQAKEAPLRSVHTTNLAQLFEQLGLSMLVSTYQSGKLITVRAADGMLNTHFRDFQSPMGLAADSARLAIGTKVQLWEYRNQPEVGRKLEPAGKHDACFLPRRSHFTGDIRIHEIAYANDELWMVNTAFSCLCTLDDEHSFVPRWRPRFISALSPEDRCHLNGLAIVNGRPRYVTALGQTDTAGGWRQNKPSGGCLLDVDSGEVLLAGLSMPHSPRWYRDRLWLLESGKGTLATLDPASGKLKTITELPGFTRGLAFAGPLAFIGLSQVRETAVFGGLPITERMQERVCGVWVVHIDTGKTVGFLKFEGSVQEIFDVQLLHGLRFPEVSAPSEPVIATSYVLPREALKHVAPA